MAPLPFVLLDEIGGGARQVAAIVIPSVTLSANALPVDSCIVLTLTLTLTLTQPM